MKIKDFLDYVQNAKSKATFKNYKVGLKKFFEWYGKDGDTILKERFEDLQEKEDQQKRRRFNRQLEMFHRHLKNTGYAQNTAVAYLDGVRQLFRYFDMDIKNLPTEVTRKTTTVKDYIPTVQEYRNMFNCGNILDRTIISMGLDLGWRIGDFLSIKKDMLPNLEGETPLSFDLLTHKEEVISKSFLSGQSVNLLKSYIPTLPKDNLYLFGRNGSGHYDPEAITKRLKVLAKKANIHMPKGKSLRFHCFRKRVFSEASNLKIRFDTACVLVGKSVPHDKLTYLSEVNHKEAFNELHKVLAMTETQTVMNGKDREIEAFKQKLEEQEIYNRGLLEDLRKVKNEFEAFKETQKEKTKTQLEPLDTTKAYATEEPESIEDYEAYIKELGKASLEKEREQYAKAIENENNNH